ncbi:MAG: GNAT family N-acetyltransferase [Acidimicrobiia bacterium]|nr:GNAT family N-acetyltransferase [Acidimicrobiia bacterium]
MDLPKGYSAVPASRDDIEEVWRMMVEVNLAEAGTPGFGLAEMENWLTGKPIVIGEDVMLVRDGGGELVGVEIVDCRPPFVRPHVIGGVRPAHTGLGIGNALLTWAKNWTIDRLDNAPENARVTFLTSTAADHTHSARTMSDFGLELVRYFIDMQIGFDGKPPDPVIPAGITIREFDPDSELEELTDLFRDSFRDHYGYVEGPREARIEYFKHWMTQSDHDPYLWWVAEDSGRLVAHNLCEPTNEGDPNVGYVASLAVHPTHRGRGLGRALLLAAFNRFFEMGKTGAALGVDADSLTGATKLYESVGMAPYTKYAMWEMVIREGDEMATLDLDD